MNRNTAGIVFAIGVAAAAFAGTASAQNSPAIAALDTSLRAAVERKDVPGVVALVTDRKGVVYQGAFGVADIDQARPLKVDSLFRIASWPGRIESTPCSTSHLWRSKPKYCLLHSIPASACRMTRASSLLTRSGVMSW